MLLLNELDGWLDAKNGGIVLAVASLFVHITQNHKNLRHATVVGSVTSL